ncbi:hypothetical protein FRC01_013349, partial [Tulasnella sp. 417]
MSTLEAYSYPHLSNDLSRVFVGLLVDVKNASSIRSRIIAASTAAGEAGDIEREAVNFAFIDART